VPTRTASARATQERGALGEDERETDRVDRREDHICRVRNAKRREHRCKVAAVAAHAVERPVDREVSGAGPRGSFRLLEVVPHLDASPDELVESKQPVPLGRTSRLAQRSAPFRRVPKGVENLHVEVTR
jgi:hypothetical protein